MNERLNLSIFAINLNAILTGLIWIESLDIVGRTLLLSPCYYLDQRLLELFTVSGTCSTFNVFCCYYINHVTGVARDQERVETWIGMHEQLLYVKSPQKLNLLKTPLNT